MSKNLKCPRAAFAGEPQARLKRTYFAVIARRKGYHSTAQTFDDTANNQRRHARDELALPNSNGYTVTILKGAIEGDVLEATELCPTFADEVKVEGDQAAALSFMKILNVEQHHKEKFQKLLSLGEPGMVRKRKQPIAWNCRVCGYVHDSDERPNTCPYCLHAGEFNKPACSEGH
jgi:rubrerythrin